MGEPLRGDGVAVRALELIDRFWAARPNKSETDKPQIVVRGASYSNGTLHLHCELSKYSVVRALGNRAHAILHTLSGPETARLHTLPT